MTIVVTVSIPNVDIARVREVESHVVPGSTQLADAVARYDFKLRAVKDEYEVARLHSDPAFQQKIAALFEGAYRVPDHLAPPLLARRTAQARSLDELLFALIVLGDDRVVEQTVISQAKYAPSA